MRGGKTIVKRRRCYGWGFPIAGAKTATRSGYAEPTKNACPIRPDFRERGSARGFGTVIGLIPVVLGAIIVRPLALVSVLALCSLGCAFGRPRMTSTWRPTARDATAAAPVGSIGATGSEPGPKTEPTKIVEGQPTYQLERVESGSTAAFARIMVDVPMLLGSRGGASIGFLRKGTRVKLAAQSDGDTDTVSVAAPFPAVNRYGGVRSSGESGVEGPLFVSIATTTSANQAKKFVTVPPTDALAQARYGLYRELSATPGGPGYAFVKCGKVRVLERKGSRLRVAAEYDSGELYGWMEAPKPDERDAGCDWGVQPQLPYGYLRVQASAAAALTNLAQTKAEVYWVSHKAESTRCERWLFAPGKESSTGWLYLQDEGTPSADATRTERSYGVVGNVLSLGGLVYRQQGAAVVAGGKVDFFAVVRADGDALDVLEWEPPSSSPEPALLGFRASTARTWYLSRAACESGVVKQAGARLRP